MFWEFFSGRDGLTIYSFNTRCSDLIIHVPNTCFLVFKLLTIYFLQLVAGSVVMAFLTVCPERIDLIHKNYRKLCNLLVDVDEWGQVMILNLLTRYARTQFIDPNNEVRSGYSVVLPIRCQYLLDVMYNVFCD